MMKNSQVSRLQAKELPTPERGDGCPGGSSTRGTDLVSHQRDVALIWARRGIPVVPCSPKDKGALVPGFGKDKTSAELSKFSDLTQITDWWSGRFKRAHVGLLTRQLVVVDLDQAKAGTPPLDPARWPGALHGTDVLEQLVREADAEWPETYTVLTPSGGMHLYFTQPEGEPIGCATGEGTTAPHLGPLVDVRGIGGYVIAAGSYSAAQGRPYERVTPAALGPQPLPAWLLARLRPAVQPVAPRARAPRVMVKAGTRAERYASIALQGEVDGVASAPAGERNRRLYAAARRLGELSGTAPTVLAESVVQDELLGAALTAGLRGGEREALATIRSGWARGCETQVSAA